MRNSFAGFFILLALACTLHIATSATHYVWQDSPSPGPPYDSWATAAHVIQDPVDAAVDGATEAIQFWQKGGGVGVVAGGAGFAFSPGVTIRVTTLGYGGASLADEPQRVGLWSDRGALLESTVVTTNSPFFNQSHYEMISGIDLAAGQTYFLSSVGESSGLWIGDLAIFPDGRFDVAPEIVYLGPAQGITTNGSFPVEIFDDPFAYFAGPNFEFTVIADINPPELVYASGDETFENIRIVFNEFMDESSSTNLLAYQVEDEFGTVLALDGVRLGANGREVALHLDSSAARLQPDRTYTVTVTGVRDLALNEIAPNSQIEFTVIADVDPPELVYAGGGETFENIRIVFSEFMDESSSTNSLAYEVEDEFGTVLALDLVRPGANGREVALHVDSSAARLQPGRTYTVTVTGVRDLALNEIAPNSQIQFRIVITPGFVKQEFWFALPGVTLSDLTNNPAYPDNPDEVSYISSIEILENQFDNYGVQLSGLLLPTVGGDHHFWMSSDEQGDFFLSANQSPEILELVAWEPQWNLSRDWLGTSRRDPAAPENRSTTLFPGGLPLEANGAYAFRARMKEGDLNDNLGVTWQEPGMSPPIAGSPPIGGLNVGVVADTNGASVTILRQPRDALAAIGSDAYFSDFENDLPTGSAVWGTARVSGGMLQLTPALNSQNGSLVIEDINNGQPVEEFTARFMVRMGDSTCCTGPRPGDGMSFNFASDLPDGTFFPATPCCGAEDGGGTGLTVSFDAWDNGPANDPTDAPAIEVIYNGEVKATVSMAGVREGNRAPLTAIPTDPATGQPMTLFTLGPEFVPVLVRLDPDGTVDVSYKGVMVLENVDTGYTPFAGRFGFGARTAGANETHWVDNLIITLRAEGGPGTAAFSVGAVGAIIGNNDHPLFHQWERSDDDGASWATIPNANSASYSKPAELGDNGALFRARIYVPGAQAVSESARLTVTGPPLTEVRVVDGIAQFEFDTAVGYRYVVERKLQLDDLAWTEVGVWVGTGIKVEFTEAVSANTSAFYRIRVEWDDML